MKKDSTTKRLDKLEKNLGRLVQQVKQWRNQCDDLLTQIAALEKAGVTTAKPSWKRDFKGEPAYLVMVHKKAEGKRKREYVGKDKEKQEQALAMVQREKDRKELVARLEELDTAIRKVEYFFLYR